LIGFPFQQHRIWSPGKPGPAIITTNATSIDRLATIGPISPPSLWPMRPMCFASMSIALFFRPAMNRL